MRNITTIATTAAMAMGLTVASVPPAEALGNNGLSPKQANQVRTIVKQEVRKVPVGKMLFAFVRADGTVISELSNGIKTENVRYEDWASPANPELVYASYCFIGLPLVRGGQVTSGIGDGFFPIVTLNFDTTGTIPDCPVRVITTQNRESIDAAGFNILLY